METKRGTARMVVKAVAIGVAVLLVMLFGIFLIYVAGIFWLMSLRD